MGMGALFLGLVELAAPIGRPPVLPRFTTGLVLLQRIWLANDGGAIAVVSRVIENRGRSIPRRELGAKATHSAGGHGAGEFARFPLT